MELTPEISRLLREAADKLDEAHEVARAEWGDADGRTNVLLHAWAIVIDVRVEPTGRRPRG